MAEGYRKTKLRRSAEAQGFAITREQFDHYFDEGLLPQPDENGCWSLEVVDMLLAIRALGETVRPLPRRLIHLYGHPLFPHITREQVYAAALEIGRKMENPDAKMRAVDAIMRRIAPVREMVPYDALLQDAAKQQSERPPTTEEWLGALRLGQPLFTGRVQEWQTWARCLSHNTFPADGTAVHETAIGMLYPTLRHTNIGMDGTAIPCEELIALIAGWFLSRLLKHAAAYTQSITPERTPAEIARAVAEVVA